jgi:hypothetical protein
MPKGEIVGMFYRKSVFFIDGKNNKMMENRKIISLGGQVNSIQRSKLRRESTVQ